MAIKYDQIGKEYNLTRKADPYLVERLFHHLSPNQNDLYLDIGCGTGNYTIELNKRGIKLIGIDPSKEMLDKAKKRNQSVIWKMGTAENIPLKNEHVNGIIASLTLHHWDSLDIGFKELFRILKPNGKIVLFTATPKQMEGYWLNYYFPNIMKKSILQMPTFAGIENDMNKNSIEITGAEKYYIQYDLQDLFLYSGKHRPSFYLDEKIRQGISSFSSLANKEEVEIGLLKLKKDLVTGKINQVISDFDNQDGDYLFITAKKS